jgi:hypothetical protein
VQHVQNDAVDQQCGQDKGRHTNRNVFNKPGKLLFAPERFTLRLLLLRRRHSLLQFLPTYLSPKQRDDNVGAPDDKPN